MVLLKTMSEMLKIISHHGTNVLIVIITLISSSRAVAMFVCLSMFFFLSRSSGNELMADVSLAVLSVNSTSLPSPNSPFSVSDGPYRTMELICYI